MTTSPTARTLQRCRDNGWEPDVVERRIPRTFVTRDLFGIIDIVVLDGQPGLLGIQATSTDNIGSRVKKIRASENARKWTAAGNRLEVWGWALRGAVGKRKLWTLKVAVVGFDAEEGE